MASGARLTPPQSGGFFHFQPPGLGRNGTSVLLGGMPAFPAAVRYAWRAYPCEREGCGLHSAAEGVPPPPFHAWVELGRMA